jgi:hypothetical protein
VTTIIPLVAVLAMLVVAPFMGSGGVGIYGIIEEVVMEPNESAPERIQLWGAFAYVETSDGFGTTVSAAKRGYLYFRLEAPAYGPRFNPRVVLNEWADLKAVAGTGQAVGFGSWGYIGGFGGLQPDRHPRSPPYIIESSAGRPLTDLRVHPPAEPPASPALYQTDTGIVKLADAGSHAAIVQRLREALKRTDR